MRRSPLIDGLGERGSAFIIITFFIGALFAFATLSLDVANVLREQRRAHIGTDSAALAAVAKLGGSSVPEATQAAAAIAEALVIANTNGVTDAEIAAGARNGFPGQIQVGQWTNGLFAPNLTPYNAVRVPARRTVPLYFGKIVGVSHITPAVDSVAMVGATAIPYGVPTNALVDVGATLTLGTWAPGNWGVLDNCGTLNGAPRTAEALAGPGCFATIGQVTGVATGFDGVKDGFKTRFNSGNDADKTVVLPVVDSFPNGNHEATIVDFIVVKLLDEGRESGSNWELDVEVLAVGFDGLKTQGLGPSRTLVE